MIRNNFAVMTAQKMVKISDVAIDTGISRTTLTNLYYKRSKQISFEVLDKLCKCLECTPSDIFEFKN